jgi:DUF1680 family protein
MLSWRLLLATGETRFADLAERTLLNVVATSPAPDGRAFFYANPLHQRVPGVVPSPDFVSNRAASSLREPWFAVSCCPTNVARTFASLAGYLATTNGSGLQIHQYATSRISTTLGDGRRVGVEVDTSYPDDGKVSIKVTEADGSPWTLSLRVPEWSSRAGLVVAGERRSIGPGEARVERSFSVGDVVELELDMTPRWTWPDPRIDSIRGCVAVERGPLVLCVESVDLPGEESVDTVRIDAGSDLAERDGLVTVGGSLLTFEDEPWPSAPVLAGRSEATIPLTPYHDWANRGPSTMRVWMPVLDDAQ